jgi:hypothetical protein
MSEMSIPPGGELDEAYYPELDELPPRPRRKLLTPVTVLLLLALFAAAGFVGGVLVQKGQASSTSTVGGGFASRFGAAGATGATGTSAAASGFRSLFGGGAGGGGATIGTVSSIDGRTLYVTETSGNTIAVVTTAESKITKDESVGSNGIHPGDSVVVEGIAGSKGTVTASSVSDSGSSSSGNGGIASLFGGGSSARSSNSSSGATGTSGLFGP